MDFDMDFGPLCQSCGMPLERDEDFGTEAGGDRSREYCRYCRKDGTFTDEGITLAGKIDKVVSIAVEKLGVGESTARGMAGEILPQLKRWKDSQ